MKINLMNVPLGMCLYRFACYKFSSLIRIYFPPKRCRKFLCLFIKINAAVASSRFYYAIFTQSLFLTTSSSLSSLPSSLSHVSMCVFHRKNLRIIFQFIMVTFLLLLLFPQLHFPL